MLFYWNFRIHILASYKSIIEDVCKHCNYKPVTAHVTYGTCEEVLDKRHDATTDNHHHEDT